jgi:hypothetical protein
MDKILELFKRRVWVSKITKKEQEMYLMDLSSKQITEEEYNLILELLKSEDEKDEQHNN